MNDAMQIDPTAIFEGELVLKDGGRILGPSVIGAGCILGDGVIIGHPSKRTLLEGRDFRTSSGAHLGQRSILRSGTVIYENVTIGDDFQCGHHTVVREGVVIGRNCGIGSHCVLEWRSQIGDNCRLQNNIIVAETAVIGANVFIGPNVSMTSGRYMLMGLVAGNKLTSADFQEREKQYLDRPTIVVEDDVRIGANAVILAGVRLGKGCVVAAGAVVTGDVPCDALVAGNPGRLLKTKMTL
jgi:acetyltransferase-like isoleucine patch superfamily enzyme